MDIAKFEEKMNFFNFKNHQYILMYLKTLESAGFSINDIEKYVDFKRKEMSELETIYREIELDKDILPNCPECGEKLTVRVINLPKSKSNFYGWRSCLECTGCIFEKYSKKRAEDVLKFIYNESNIEKILEFII